MASIWRLARTLQSCRTIASSKTLNPRPYLSTSPRLPPPSICNRIFEQQNTNGSEGPRSNGVHELSVHTVLAGLLGFGLLDVSFADGVEADSKSPPLPESAKIPPLSESAESPPVPESAESPAVPESAESSPVPESAESSPVPESGISPPPPKSPTSSSHQDLEELAKTEKARLEELIRSRGGTRYSYPRFTVAVKGQKVTIKFLVPPTCELPILITNLVSRLGVKAGDSADGSDMILRAWDSGVAWQLTLTRPTPRTKANEDRAQEEDKNANDGDLCILMFRPLISTDKTEIEFMKSGSFSLEELDALASIMYLSGQPRILQPRPQPRPKEDASKVPTIDKTVSSLEAMGVKVYGLKQPNIEHPKVDISWDNIAGYDNQKREIEDTILLALKSPEVYDDIARGTRCKFEPNRPRAVLFEGPPGTGKTSCARVIANQGGVPLLYVPLEIIMSKFYGESERLLGKVFSLAKEIPSGAIIFLDEVDSIATARDSETHEATRRLLSVLLRQIDGFEQDKKVVVIAATNRKQDLDPALHSRFDSMIMFDLPDHQTREAIIAQYAKHLTKSEMAELATATEEMSGRDIRDVCQQAERHWASKIIRGQAPKNEEHISLPPLHEYTESAFKRRGTMFSSRNQMRDPRCLSKKPQFDFL